MLVDLSCLSRDSRAGESGTAAGGFDLRSPAPGNFKPLRLDSRLQDDNQCKIRRNQQIFCAARAYDVVAALPRRSRSR